MNISPRNSNQAYWSNTNIRVFAVRWNKWNDKYILKVLAQLNCNFKLTKFHWKKISYLLIEGYILVRKTPYLSHNYLRTLAVRAKKEEKWVEWIIAMIILIVYELLTSYTMGYCMIKSKISFPSSWKKCIIFCYLTTLRTTSHCWNLKSNDKTC